MRKYVRNPKPEKSVKVFGRGLRISNKNSVLVCKKISGMNLEKGKVFLERLVSKKESMDGKYYTNAAKEISQLLMQAEHNADFKGLDTSRIIIFASAHKGFTFWRPRRFKLRRRKRKVTHIQIVLEQR